MTISEELRILADNSEHPNTVAILRHAASALEQEGWRDISTAPKDGTVVLIARDMGAPWGFVRAFGYWVSHGGISGWVPTGAASNPPGVLGLAAPDCWMPLPPPPTGGGK